MKAIKVALCGKQEVGKNLTAKLIAKELCDARKNYKILAFADPIKNMVLQMFPASDKKCLFGSSQLRNEVIPGNIIKDGKLLTYRQVLIDLGTLARQYDPNVWVKAFDERIKALTAQKLVICSDLRFVNEMNYLKENGFFIIRIKRNAVNKSKDATETEQDKITDEQFDYILENNGTIKDLKANISEIVGLLKE